MRILPRMVKVEGSRNQNRVEQVWVHDNGVVNSRSKGFDVVNALAVADNMVLLGVTAMDRKFAREMPHRYVYST